MAYHQDTTGKIIRKITSLILIGDQSNPIFEPFETTLAWLESLREVYEDI